MDDGNSQETIVSSGDSLGQHPAYTCELAWGPPRRASLPAHSERGATSTTGPPGSGVSEAWEAEAHPFDLQGGCLSHGGK